MLARPGMAISLSAAAIHVGAKEFLEGKGAKALEKMPRFFETSSGKELLSAVKTLNLGKSGSASRSALKKAVKKYIDFMQADNEDLQKALVRVVNSFPCVLASNAPLGAEGLLPQDRQLGEKVEAKRQGAVGNQSVAERPVKHRQTHSGPRRHGPPKDQAQPQEGQRRRQW